ncbi:uncharacterized protein PHA67_007007 isoform 2-T2 [Liasis olivaceus]
MATEGEGTTATLKRFLGGGGGATTTVVVSTAPAEGLPRPPTWQRGACVEAPADGLPARSLSAFGSCPAAEVGEEWEMWGLPLQESFLGCSCLADPNHAGG